MSVRDVARSLAKTLIRVHEERGYPLLPLTRTLRGPLRWLYHRSPYLQHDSRFHWRPSLLLGIHGLLIRDHPRDFTIHRGQLRFRSHGSVMSFQGYYVGEIERHLVDYVVRAVRDGFTMLDVGAHHGAFTLIAAHELRARGWAGQVHSFEPDPANFELLRYNVEQNGLADRVVLHPVAVSDAAGDELLIGAVGENSGNTLATTGEFALDRSATARVSQRVAVVALDDLLAELPRVDFIKLDIQGAEPLALAGGRRLLDRDRPVIAVEAVEGWPSSVRTRELLVERGYRLHGLTKRGELCEVGAPEAFVSWDWVAVPTGPD
jgi:FkbM family methyltransferase